MRAEQSHKVGGVFISQARWIGLPTAELDQEVRNEEDRVKIHDPAHSAYSTYARATTLRRDNLRRSADELRTHLAKAQKALIELGDATLDA